MVTTPIGAILQIQASATTGNVNGAGFNPTATYFNTDLAATLANTTAPVVTSASYSFVAADAATPANYVYVKSGTHWQAGWYPIASVNAGAGSATLNAAIGAVVLTISSTGVVTYNTTAGCTSDATATLSGGTYGVDYSQTDAAMATSSTATSSGAGAVILFAGSTASMLGNYVQIISGTNATAGWYEIIAESAGVSITTDRNSTTGVGASIVMNIGGAGRLNGNEDNFQAVLPAGAQVFVKNGSYTLSGAISTASANGTGASSIYWNGYNAVRGDVCNGANRPVIVAGANAVQFSTFHILSNFSFTTTTAAGINGRTSTEFYNCKARNSSTTAARAAFTMQTGIILTNCEAISQNGTAVVPNASGGSIINGCYIHDSANGVSTVNAAATILSTIFEYCPTNAINLTVGTGGNFIQGCTIYGAETPVASSSGVHLASSSPSNYISDNIIYGYATGINLPIASQTSNFSQYNDFFNNTADGALWIKSTSDLALNPTFTNVSQVTGTVGQGLASSKFQDTTKNFTTLGVVANQDFLHVISGGSLTAGCYFITAITTTTNPNDTLTLENSAGTGAAAAVYTIPIGHNFQIGTNLKAKGFPSFTNATNSITTSYPDVGAVQRQESSATAGGSFTFVG